MTFYKRSKIIVGILFIFLVIELPAQTKKTFTYAIKEGNNLQLDVYVPENTQQKKPFLIWMHGGGFAVGSRDGEADAALAKKASQSGFIGVSISYRLSRKGDPNQFGCNCPRSVKLETFQMAVEDYLDAVLFVVNHAQEFNGDSSKIIAGGSSAGAEGVLNAVYMREYFITNLEKYKDIGFSGVISLAGAMVQADYIQKANAVPAILAHGTDDNLVPYATSAHHQCSPDTMGYILLEGSKSIADRLKDLQKSYWLDTYLGGKHEVSSIPMEKLEDYFDFIQKTMIQNNEEQIETYTKNETLF